jgi:hypothetical protein
MVINFKPGGTPIGLCSCFSVDAGSEWPCARHQGQPVECDAGLSPSGGLVMREEKRKRGKEERNEDD